MNTIIIINYMKIFILNVGVNEETSKEGKKGRKKKKKEASSNTLNSFCNASVF